MVSDRQLALPEPLVGCALNSGSDVFAEARRGAETQRYRAGDLAWATHEDGVDCAIVLEPVVEAEAALDMFFVAQVAAGDALEALGYQGVKAQWPQWVVCHDSTCVKAQFAFSAARGSDNFPIWSVVGMRFKGDFGSSSTDLLCTFAEYFLARVDAWETQGFQVIADAYLSRAIALLGECEIQTIHGVRSGMTVGLDDHGNLLLKEGDEIALVRVIDVLEPEQRDVA
ncbi:MAG: biotin/lipoate--protein ligase family protein [Pseudomonadota bacterium]